jgi:hypothetical protein
LSFRSEDIFEEIWLEFLSLSKNSEIIFLEF